MFVEVFISHNLINEDPRSNVTLLELLPFSDTSLAEELLYYRLFILDMFANVWNIARFNGLQIRRHVQVGCQ